MSTVTLHIGDVFDRMAELPDGSVDLIDTSPPFLALRSYLPADHPDKPREIGSEPTPADYLDTLLTWTAECRRVLAPHGSLCVELGDTYSGSGGAGGDYMPGGWRAGQPGAAGSMKTERVHKIDGWGPFRDDFKGGGPNGPGWPLAKSLTGIPTLYTWSLAYGRNLLTGAPSPAGQWRIRNLLVWARPNPPVGALGDKFRPACSYITVACTGAKRWFDLDAVRTDLKNPDCEGFSRVNGEKYRQRPGHGISGGLEQGMAQYDTNRSNPASAPPLDWHQDGDDGPTGDRLWQMSTQPYRGAHYATYPTELPRRLIEAMCPRQVCRECGKARKRIVEATRRTEKDDSTRIKARPNEPHINGSLDHPPEIGWEFDRSTLGWSDCGHENYRPGLILDPFLGSGTSAVAAAQLGRDCIGIDLDARNAALVDRRLRERLHIAARDGNDSTMTWECDAPLPDQASQLDGQTNLLDLMDIPTDVVDIDTGELP